MRDVRGSTLDVAASPEVYAPLAQTPLSFGTVVARVSGNPVHYTAALRTAVSATDAEQAAGQVHPMEEVLAQSLARRRFGTFLLALFAGVALALSTIGIYGVMASMVVQRNREIAVRMALGAKPVDVLRLVVRHGASLTGIGVAAGLLGALALTRLLTGLLYGIQAGDPLTLAAVSMVLAVVALAASYVPARRATRVDPIVVLRYE
jgi:putative ABC transport system permease protein